MPASTQSPLSAVGGVIVPLGGPFRRESRYDGEKPIDAAADGFEVVGLPPAHSHGFPHLGGRGHLRRDLASRTYRR